MAVPTFISSFSKKYKIQFEKYKKYIHNNNWGILTADENLREDLFIEYIEKEHKDKKIIQSEIAKYVKEKLAAQKSLIKSKTDEFKLQDDIAKTILERLKYFCKKTQGDQHLKEFKSFIKYSLAIIQMHIDRVNNYTDSIDISQIENQDIRSEEMKFLRECSAAISKIDDEITALNIKEDSAIEDTVVSFHENTKIAPLSMHHILYEEYPVIKRIVDSLKLDWTTPPKNEMHIHNPNPPKWNPDKHYFLQEKATLQYYIEEMKKIENGVKIGGIDFEPWLYFHMNHFVTEIPTVIKNQLTGEDKIKKVVQVPALRDNEFYVIQDSYREARQTGKILFIAATRRLFKSTGLASHLYHKVLTGGKELVVAGGSAKDLGQLEKNIKVCATYINPAFAVNNISNDWTKKIPLGIRTKANKIYNQCIIHVINLDGGHNSEILAGYTPDALVIDECMKQPFIEQLNGAKPSFDTPNGMLCCPILSGTGGDEDMSKDAHKVLNDPDAYKVYQCNWEALERGIPKEDIKFTRRSFGTFAPAAMSAKTGMIKVKSNLAKYLDKPGNKELENIEILVTDWKRCNEIIQKDRDSLKNDRVSLTKEIVYYPNDPNEIFKSGKISPFTNLEELAKNRRDYLIRTGKWDRRRTLTKDNNGKIHADITTKELVPFPFSGGNEDAPYLIFEDIPDYKPSKYTFVASADFVKQETTNSTDSLVTVGVYKYNLFGDPYAKKLVASWAGRPKTYKEINERVFMLLEAYNAILFPENEDLGVFQTFLESKKLETEYLERHIDFNTALNYSESPIRKYGYTAKQSRSRLLSMYANYLDEDVTIVNDEGETVTVKMVQTVDDIWLLEEIITFTEGGNYDRISGHMAAPALLHVLEKQYIYPKGMNRRHQNPDESEKQKPQKQMTFYKSQPKGTRFYRGR